MGNTIINVNKRQYTGGDVTVTLLGYEEEEVKEIDYDYTRLHNYNKSLKGITSWSMGGIDEMTCKLTLYMTAVERIRKEAKKIGVNDITLLKPFPVAVVFTNEELEEVVDIVTMKFQKMGRTITTTEGLAQQFDMFVTALNIGK